MLEQRSDGDHALAWVEHVQTVDAEDPVVKAIDANPGWRLLGVGVGAGGQTTLTYGWGWPGEERALLARYGHHTNKCAYINLANLGDCNCGWAQIEATLQPPSAASQETDS